MNHTILELVISSFVIIIITTINTCQDLSKIQSPISLSTGSFSRLFLSIRYHWFPERSTNNPFLRRTCLECLAFAFGLSAFANWLAWVACAVPRGGPSGLVSLVADGSDGVAPAGLYS